jgi:hypothetical protein
MFGPVAARRVSVMLVGLAVLTAGCGGSSSTTTPPAPGGSTVTTASGSENGTSHIARPVSATPSKSAQMVCSPEAQQQILADATGVRVTQPVTATWKDDLYSCRYMYGANFMVLSVKELANITETNRYFALLARQLGVSRNVPIGPRGFVARNGSVVVQKDYKVLLVDVARLPQQFGEPIDSRENIALNVATAIIGCWTGE